MSVFSAARLRLLRRGLPFFLVLFSALQGCSPLPLINGETLYVMVVTQRRLDWLRRDALEEQLWAPLLEEFHRLHPHVGVSVYTVNEGELIDELRLRTARGLGPDLILVRAPMANTLFKQRLIAPVPRTPTMGNTITQVFPTYLERVRFGSELAGLPLHDLVTLACYNRDQMPTPPRTTEELMALAASGRTIGLSIDSYGLWWTAGTKDAASTIVELLMGQGPQTPAARREAESKIAGWLVWLRQLAVQSKVDLASGPQELTQGLETGRLEWIPCFSLTLDTLKHSMGKRLGVSALPSGPGGLPSPFNTLQVWAFGLDSSPRQRQNAADLAKLSLDPLLQRRFVLDSQEVLPVNRFVQTPVASSGVLAALAEALRQSTLSVQVFRKPFDLEHVTVVLTDMEAVVQQVMVGLLTPKDGAMRILQMGDRSR